MSLDGGFLAASVVFLFYIGVQHMFHQICLHSIFCSLNYATNKKIKLLNLLCSEKLSIIELFASTCIFD
jgi:hypothetical protein